MLRFKTLLFAIAFLLKRKVRKNPEAATYIAGKDLTFRIATTAGVGRTFTVRNGRISSSATALGRPTFSLIFKDGDTGFSVLSAKDSQAAFLQALGQKDLQIEGRVLDVMWFQGLTGFLQPPKRVAPMDRTAF